MLTRLEITYGCMVIVDESFKHLMQQLRVMNCRLKTEQPDTIQVSVIGNSRRPMPDLFTVFDSIKGSIHVPLTTPCDIAHKDLSASLDIRLALSRYLFTVHRPVFRLNYCLIKLEQICNTCETL